MQQIRDHSDPWEEPPTEMQSNILNPHMTLSDLRAISEKKMKKELMDLEWQRRQAKIGKLTYPDPGQDARLTRFAWQYRDWSDEEIRNLITNNGINCKPEDHQGIVENPLVPVDHVNVLGIKYIEEVEDFLDRIGHLGKPEEDTIFNEALMLEWVDSSPQGRVDYPGVCAFPHMHAPMLPFSRCSTSLNSHVHLSCCITQNLAPGS